MSIHEIQIRRAKASDEQHAHTLKEWYIQSALDRGTGIARRSLSYLIDRIQTGHSVIALSDNALCGFCYIETWNHGRFVANSGLIVHPQYRSKGLGKAIKSEVFHLARSLYPTAAVFGITTSSSVMNINYDLGYKPVAFSALPTDQSFWDGCSSCPNHDILLRTEHKYCLCTGMLAPSQKEDIKYNLNHFILNNDDDK